MNKRVFQVSRTAGIATLLTLSFGLGGCSSASHASAGPSTAGAGSVSVAAPEAVASFDVSKGELPEGLAIADGVPYVGLAPSGQISKVNLSDGSLSPFAKLPTPTPGKGFMTGLAFSAGDPGVLYAGLVSFVPEVQAGIYRVGADGGDAQLFAAAPDMVFPNGLWADEDGSWFVADSNAGAIFKLSKSGKTVEKWATDELFAGDSQHSCASQQQAGLPFNIGANGIAKMGGAFYVTNTDKGLIARVLVEADGKAGKVSLFAGPDCATLGGADGLTPHDGSLIVASNVQNELVAVDAKGAVTQLSVGAPLDFPASPVFDGDTLYVTNFAFMNAQSGKGSPGLIRLQATTGH
jgi:sugar lactone lactonase YvrE